MNKILVMGLGAGDLEQLPLGIYRLLKEGEHIYLRTKEHPVIYELGKEGLEFQSFDSIYEQFDSFEEVYEEICAELFRYAKKDSIVYAVPGHPLVAERTVQILLERAAEHGIEVEIGGGQSFLDPLFQAVQIDPIEGFQLLDATSLRRDEIEVRQHMIIGQVYDTFMASEVKLTLMELLPDEYEVYIVTAAGSKEERVQRVPLFELDREVSLNNLTSVYVPPVSDEVVLYKQFSKLRQIIAELRGPNGCPWDKEQTHHSLKKYLLEEAYELIEAIQEEDYDHMIEELGDVLLQVMLHAQIGEDDGYFSINDVIESISAKMVRRHPHVFGDKEADTADEVVKNWQEIKKEEKGEEVEKTLLDKVGKHLPNTLRAFEIQKQAAKVGFDWEKVEEAWDKVKEEMQEFEVEVRENHPHQSVEEFGDILFALINVARFHQINPEEALLATNQKFIRRFSYVEDCVNRSGKDFKDFSLMELDHFWNEAKKKGL
ncbi:nucleoside triphosphate pyrophosphohydrolase [Robertmurraya andreesenii]|uniref:Tetrapyrrole methylase family protein/MazG family protein n=1 Tax=Anoxybacillus andreesenii TaxID=1325932 RepID=A0ABT9V9X0_9BACL|nr:nucleoside triphosphate pyrophosphohydrolase [Robertmurraya andreesenii]MDQ0157715.1 tetrapyrrole methylase family protein/MazG family protein [Robertmurraya andreesenii]